MRAADDRVQAEKYVGHEKVSFIFLLHINFSGLFSIEFRIGSTRLYRVCVARSREPFYSDNDIAA